MQELEAPKLEHTFNAPRPALTFIHSPFCGTCHLAREMLQTLEAVFEKDVFIEMNAALNPSLMERLQIKSVPCLLVTKRGKVEKKIYAFHSVPYMYEQILEFVE